MQERAETVLDIEMRVLSTLAELLTRAARLTEDIEETISAAIDEQDAGEDWLVRDLQQLDLLRQMQGDLSRVLDHLSAHKKDIADVDDLTILRDLCHLGMVREAIETSLQKNASMQVGEQKSETEDVKANTVMAGTVDLF